jgi:hypothetical protein
MDRVVDASERWLPSSQVCQSLETENIFDLDSIEYVTPRCTSIMVVEVYAAVAKVC